MRANLLARACVLALALPACAAPYEGDEEPDIGSRTDGVVYGSESRVWTFQADEVARRWSRSVGVLTTDTDILVTGGTGYCNKADPSCTISTTPFTTVDPNSNGVPDPLCGPSSTAPAVGYGEPTPVGGGCTAFIVGPKLMATAAHCMADQFVCSGTNVSFGFEKASVTQKATGKVAGADVYSCTRLVSRLEVSFADYAIFEVDRPISNRPPVPIQRVAKPTLGTDLVMIGHPTGLPAMVAPGKVVLNPPSAKNPHDVRWFEANLDAFHGNSGSPVFNRRTGAVEGILVSGNNDWRWVAASSCYSENLCNETSCNLENDAEHVTSAHILSTSVPLDPASILAAIQG